MIPVAQRKAIAQLVEEELRLADDATVKITIEQGERGIRVLVQDKWSNTPFLVRSDGWKTPLGGGAKVRPRSRLGGDPLRPANWGKR